MQAVYLLEMSNVSMTRLGPYSAGLRSQTVGFTPDSLLIVEVTLPAARQGCQIDVFKRSGACCASFAGPAFSKTPSLILLQASRVAFKHTQEFTVWDLHSGKLLSTVCPAAQQSYDMQRRYAALLLQNPAGTKLAFCASGALSLHVYDAASLSVLACVQLPFGTGPAPDQRLLTKLVWGTFGWLAWRTHTSGGVRSHEVHVVKHEAGGSSQRKLLNHRSQSSAYATSPDGAYICFSSPSDLAICDTRTGHAAAKVRPDMLPSKGFRGRSIHGMKLLGWSSCGRCIPVRTLIYHGSTVTERVSLILI